MTDITSTLKKKSSGVKQTVLNLKKDEYSNVQKHCNQKGSEYEKLNNQRLFDRGLKSENKKDAVVSYMEGNQKRSKEPDHFIKSEYGNYWIESTIALDEVRADEFNDKKNKVSAVDKNIKHFILFFEQNPNQKSRNNIKRYVSILENNGWTVLVGQKQIEDWMDGLAKKLKTSKKLNVASIKMISVKNLIQNPTNRKVDLDRCEKLAHHIIHEGFRAEIKVVPEYVRGKFTGRYMIYDGHHRYIAVTDYVIGKYGYEMDELPCIVVDWITTEDPDALHELLIADNTRENSWGVQDYVESHLGDATNRNDKDKIISYDTLNWMYEVVNESHKDNKIGHTFSPSRIFYVFGPLDFNNDAITKPVDRTITKSGKYRISENEVDTLLKPFVIKVGIPFLHWFDLNKDPHVDRKVGDVFLKYVYHLYLNGNLTMPEVNKTIHKFKKLGNKMPFNVVKKSWNEMFRNFGIALQ